LSISVRVSLSVLCWQGHFLLRCAARGERFRPRKHDQCQTSKRAQNGGDEMANKAHGKGKRDDGSRVHGI